MNVDLNKNGLIDMLEQQIQHASTSTISNFATVAKKASEIRDGANKCYFNKVNKCLVIKHGNKPMTECLQFNAKTNDINNVNSIHFLDESTLAGVVNSSQTQLTEDEKRMMVPSLNYLTSIINDISPSTIYGQLDDIATKTHDISYSNQTTTINNNLQINGNISSDWLDNEFAKYALVNHNHDSTYAQLVHNHEFNDIYKQITKTVTNENTNEEEEITETKTLQDVLDEYEQSLTTLINGKANSSHTHEISEIYKNIDDGEGNITQKTLETLINEKESAIRTLINGKANSNHTHNATEIIYKEASGNNAAVSVKKAIDDINQQLDIVDSQGQKLDLLAILFGVGSGVGFTIEGGLVYAVGTLQGEVATLQTQIGALIGDGLADNALDVFDEVGDVANGSSNLTSALSSWANCFSRLRNTWRGYSQVATETISPMTSGIGEAVGLVAL